MIPIKQYTNCFHSFTLLSCAISSLRSYVTSVTSLRQLLAVVNATRKRLRNIRFPSLVASSLTKFLELSGAKAPIVDNTACRVVVEFFVILHCASRCKI